MFFYRRTRKKVKIPPSRLSQIDYSRSFEVRDNTIAFKRPIKIVRGIFRAAIFSNLDFTVVLRTGWKLKDKLGERYWVAISEICHEPPILQSLFFGKGIHVELPSILIEDGDHKGTVIACLDTTSLKLKNKLSIEVFDKMGFVFGFISIGGGLVKAELDWRPNVIEPSRFSYLAELGTFVYPKRESITLEICVNSHFIRECKNLIALNKPGKARSEISYPLIRELIFGNIKGEGFKGVIKIADKFEGVLGIKRTRLRLKYKSMFGTKVLKEISLDAL